MCGVLCKIAYVCGGSRLLDEEESVTKFSVGNACFQLVFSVGICTEKMCALNLILSNSAEINTQRDV